MDFQSLLRSARSNVKKKADELFNQQPVRVNHNPLISNVASYFNSPKTLASANQNTANLRSKITNVYKPIGKQQPINWGQVGSSLSKSAQSTISSPVFKQSLSNSLTTAIPAFGVLEGAFKNKPSTFVGQYTRGQVINPILEGGKQTFGSNKTLGDRGIGGLQMLGGAFGATPAGALWNGAIGVTAGALRSARTGENLSQSINRGITSPTSLASEGLGIKNPIIALGTDLLLTRNPKTALKDPLMLKSLGENFKGVKNMANFIRAERNARIGLSKTPGLNTSTAREISELLRKNVDQGINILDAHRIRELAKVHLKLPKREYQKMGIDEMLGRLESLLDKNQRYSLLDLPPTASGFVDFGKFKPPYKPGDIKKLESYKNELLGDPKSRSVTNISRRDELEHYAKQGDQGAIDALEQIKQIESDIQSARASRVESNVPQERLTDIGSLKDDQLADVLSTSQPKQLAQGTQVQIRHTTPDGRKITSTGTIDYTERGKKTTGYRMTDDGEVPYSQTGGGKVVIRDSKGIKQIIKTENIEEIGVNPKPNVAQQQIGDTKFPKTQSGQISQEVQGMQGKTEEVQGLLPQDNSLNRNLVHLGAPNNASLDKIIPQLPAPQEMKLLPGTYSARTPAEAKRLFKRTGEVPELNFSQKNNKKVLTPPGKSEFYNASPTTNATQKHKPVLARNDDNEWEEIVFDQTGAKTTRGIIDDVSRLMQESTDAGQRKAFENNQKGRIITNKAGSKLEKGFLDRMKTWKDKPKILYQRERFDRNLEDVAGKDAPEMIKRFFKPVQKSEADRQRWLNKEREEIRSLGIRGGTKESQLLQQFGEKKLSLDSLKRELPQTWKRVVNAEKFFRQKYDQYLTDINKVLIKNGYDPIPKRKDYFRHFQDINGILERFGIPVRDNSLPTDLVGISADFKPGKNFFVNALRRKGDLTDFDAIKGIDGYLDGASKQIFHTDNIQNLRLLEKGIRERFAGTTHLSNFVSALSEYTNNLAGKKSMLDRGLEDFVGRNVYGSAQRLKKQVGANMVGANAASALTNFIPLTQSLATTSKPSFVKGLIGATISPLKDDGFVKKSNFLTSRRGSDPLYMSLWDKVGDKSGWLFKVIDNFVSQTIVRGKYHEGLSKGLSPEKALAQADNYASRLMGDRSLGSMPNLFNSKTASFFTQFQLEVNNQVSFLFKDIPKNMGYNKKQVASALAQVALYSYLYNNLYENFFGRRPAFDPIGVVQQGIEDYSNPDMKKGQATKNLAENVLNQLPFTSTFTGGRLPIGAAIPDVPALFTGESNWGKELLKPVTYLLPPSGGGQAKKTIEGVNSFMQGASTSRSGRVRYPIEQTPGNFIRMAVGGQYSTPEARDYFREGRTPLGENQSKLLMEMPQEKRQGFYNEVINLRKEDNALDDAKQKLKEGSGSTTVGDKVMWLSEDGSVQTVDLSTKANTKKGIDAFDTDSADSPISKAKKIWQAPDDQISRKEKEEIFKKLGFKWDDVRYDYIASSKFSAEEKANYIEHKNLSKKDLYKSLTTGRMESVSGNRFISDGVLDELARRGVITKVEAKAFKRMKYDKEGRLEEQSSGSGSVKKPQFVPLKISTKAMNSGIFKPITLNDAPSIPIKNVKFDLPAFTQVNSNITAPNFASKIKFNL